MGNQHHQEYQRRLREKMREHKRLYDELEATYGNMDLFIGGFDGFIKYIINAGEITNFIRWLKEPEPDWQRDC